MRSNQELHDTVVDHFLTMKSAAIESLSVGGMCAYRNLEGNKCFAGALIPDDRYEQRMERSSCDVGVVKIVLEELGYKPSRVREYQRIHDNAVADSNLYTESSQVQGSDSENWKRRCARGLIEWGNFLCLVNSDELIALDKELSS